MKKTTHINDLSVDESQHENERLSWVIVVGILFIVLVGVLWSINNDDESKEAGNVQSPPLEELASTNKNETLKNININLAESTKVEDVPVTISNNVIAHNHITTSVDKSTNVNTLIEDVPVNHLPTLNDSDNLVQTKLPELTLKKELLKLLITKDIIRRFVVFTDNFTRGSVAYEHSLFISPKSSFSAKESISKENNQTTLQWDKSSSERFNLYADLLRSLNTYELVSFYVEVKPLIDEAYNEIGYSNDFSETLQLALTQIINAKTPNGSYELSRNSVMFTYKDDFIEALSDAQKILLRIGEDNIIVIKSVLLDISTQLKKVEY